MALGALHCRQGFPLQPLPLHRNRYFRPFVESFINKSIRFVLNVFQVFATLVSTIGEVTGQFVSMVRQFRGLMKAASRIMWNVLAEERGAQEQRKCSCKVT